jgi:hypothetical protein
MQTEKDVDQLEMRDVEEVIREHVETGTEDKARDLYGDERVDDWFRARGWDPDAMREGW